jgi:hypothetical protein
VDLRAVSDSLFDLGFTDRRMDSDLLEAWPSRVEAEVASYLQTWATRPGIRSALAMLGEEIPAHVAP